MTRHPRRTARDRLHHLHHLQRTQGTDRRRRRLVLVVAVPALLASSLVGAAGTAAAATGSAAYERGVVTHLNKARDARGLPPLRVDRCADALSDSLASRMRRKRRALPLSPSLVARQCDRRLTLQAVALTHSSPRSVARGWLRHRTTRSVLLRAGSRRVGVAAVRDGSGGWYVSLLVVGSALLSSGGGTTSDGSNTGSSTGSSGGSTDGTTTDGTTAALGSEILQETNRRRVEHGLAPLDASTCATTFAQRHSDSMAADGEFAHADLSTLARECSAQGAAENIAAVLASTLDASAVVDAWMGSETHRGNILDPTLTHLGVGVAHDSATGKWYATQDFLRLS